MRVFLTAGDTNKGFAWQNAQANIVAQSKAQAKTRLKFMIMPRFDLALILRVMNSHFKFNTAWILTAWGADFVCDEFVL